MLLRVHRSLGVCARWLVLPWLALGCESTRDVIAVPADSAERTTVGCVGPELASDGVVALYTFDEDQGRSRVADVVGGHDGAVQRGLVSTVVGPEGCARAFSFTASDQYFVIDDSPVWDLDEGSIDFWLWLPDELTTNAGVLSRDLNGQDDPGHFSFFVDEEGRAITRVQPLADGSGNQTDAVSCGEQPVPRGRWFHVGVNFGPPGLELYVDGALVDGAGDTALSNDWSCQQEGTWGLAGNTLPWVVGRTTFRSEGVLQELEYPPTGGALDHLRISEVRRDFAQLL